MPIEPAMDDQIKACGSKKKVLKRVMSLVGVDMFRLEGVLRSLDGH